MDEGIVTSALGPVVAGCNSNASVRIFYYSNTVLQETMTLFPSISKSRIIHFVRPLIKRRKQQCEASTLAAATMSWDTPNKMHSSHPSSSSSQHNAQHFGAASGILQAAQHLGSIGAPAGNLNNAISRRTTNAAADRLYPSSGIMSNSTSGGQSAPPSSYGLQHSSANSPSSAAMNQQFETPRRRNPDELHLGSNVNAPRDPLSPRDYTPAGPRISLEQATPGSSQYQSGGQLPGSLQPGRPGPMSANTAPTVPTASQTLSQEQYTTPSRSSAMGLSHNYTRSSPAGFDGQGYASFGATTPGASDQYTSPTNQKYTPQNAQRTVSNTPLGLADIRPRADSGLSDNIPGANPYSYDGANAVPTNSNYLAPWAIYAFDWCKWPAQNHDAGKVAVGSYLEDGHNFVSLEMLIRPTQICR